MGELVCVDMCTSVGVKRWTKVGISDPKKSKVRKLWWEEGDGC